MKRPFIRRLRNRIQVIKSLLFAGEFRVGRAIQVRFAGVAIQRKGERRDRGRTDIFWRIKIEFHQRHMRAARISPEYRVGHRPRFRIDSAPAREAAGQYL